MSVFPADSYVWLPDDDDMWLPAKVVSSFAQGKAGSVVPIIDGKPANKQRSVSKEMSMECERMDEQSLKPVDDMVQLKQLGQESILHNLRLRYDRDQIYTSVSKILVAINPFKMLPIYSPEVMDQYLAQGGARELDPHVYAVADDAFRAMMVSSKAKDQSCVVSGESGAGKTETTKLFLQYIAEKSRREAGAAGDAGLKAGEESIQHKVLEANPLMEAFGNAKTVRNDNSSRFGKWIEIKFQGAAIVGGSIENYLLEKSRLVKQGEGERNYHIFYQLCAAAGLDPEMKKTYQLSDASQYQYLNQSKKASIEIDGVDDADEWKTTRMAMETVALKDDNVDEMISLLCGILHLGNLRFAAGSKGEETSKVTNTDMLELAAGQLGTSASKLEDALTHRLLLVGREETKADNSPEMALNARDALAKQIYTVIFDWLIEQINKALVGKGGKGGSKGSSNIGVLDIFGFETFETNSFEQLCINYCNEKLQGFFNDHIFRIEQEEYRKEGVDVEQIKYEDNSATIALIDAPKNKGILSIIQEELKAARQDFTDEKLLVKILTLADKSGDKLRAATNKESKKRSALKKCFFFTHFAGEVDYNVTDFVEKNKDILQLALYKLGTGSKSSLLKSLFKDFVVQDKKKKTLGMQFRDQLDALMSKLTQTDPHFVRCIKPNSAKRGDIFTSKMVLEQLKYAGVLEVCRIRKLGYPVRKEFAEFARRYEPLADKPKKVKGDAAKLCKALEVKGLLGDGEYQVGKNKIFMRDDQHDLLEHELELVLAERVLRIQASVRRYLVMTRKSKWDGIRKQVAKALKKRDPVKLEEALLNVGSLPYGGRHLSDIMDARDMLDTLKEEARVTELLEAAIESQEAAEITAALKTAEKSGMGDSKIAKDARAVLKEIEVTKKLREELRAAVENGADIKTLESVLAKAAKAKLENSVEARDARALLDRLTKEAGLRKTLKAAIKSKDVANIKKSMNELVTLGVSNEDALVKQAEAVAKEQAVASKEAEEQQERLLDELAEAAEARDLTALKELEVQVIQSGLSEQHPVVQQAMEVRRALEGSSEGASALNAEVRDAEHKAHSAEGVAAGDLDSLGGAISAAKDGGLDESYGERVAEAEELLSKLEKQLKAQQSVDKLVAGVESKKHTKAEKKSELLKALQQCMEFGMETAAAKKVRYWVGDIEQEDAAKNAKAMAADRLDRLDKLKEASKDELEEQAMKRLAKLTSERHMELLEQAKDDAVYDLKKYYKIRSNEDYTEGLPEEDRALASKLKLWSRSKPIPKSLLNLTDEQNRTALRVNRAVLQYCGDMSTSFPATLAQYILVKGLEDPQMCDEVYMQLCKHIFANPRPESADRAWLLLCMASKTFPPTEAFAPYLLNFLLKHQNLPGLPGNYARLCVVQLDATLELGPSWFKPNLEEIQAYRKRPPILAKVHMVSGETMDYPISPDLRVAQVLEMIRRQEGIEDDVETPSWGMFVKDAKETGKLSPRVRLEAFYKHYNATKLKHVPLFLEHWKGKEEELFAKLVEKYGPEPEDSTPSKKSGLLSASVTGAMHAAKMLGLTSARKPPPSPTSAWPLPWWSHMGDVYLRMTSQSKQPVFEFKRRLFMDDMDIDKRLYQQLMQDVKSGDLAFNREEVVAELALISVVLASERLKRPKVEKLPDAGLMKFIAPEWRRKKTPENWARVASNVNPDLPQKNEGKLMARYVELCKTSPLWGMVFFSARQNDGQEDVIVGMNSVGVHFVSRVDGDVKKTKSFPFKRIFKYGATVEYFWMTVDDGKAKQKGVFGNAGTNVLLYTLQSWEIYELCFDYTHVNQG